MFYNLLILLVFFPNPWRSSLSAKGLKRAASWLIVLAGVLSAATVRSEPIDRIIAVVNDSVIMRSEIDRQMSRIKAQMQQQKVDIPPEDALQRQVLERMIITQIQIQVAKQTGIQVDDEALNKALSNIAAQNKVSLDDFRSILERDGYSFNQFREDIRNEITVARLRQRFVDNRVSVTEREVEAYLATQQNTPATEPEYHLAHILIATPEGATPDRLREDREKAADVLKRLRAGGDFRQLAIAHSAGQQALEGGDLGWRKRGQLPSAFAERVPKMKPGELSNVIPGPGGFHIIKLLEARTGDEKVVLKQTRVRHILIKPTELVTGKEAKQRLEQLRQRIVNGDDFGELARAHSDDRGSSIKGGELDWVSPGELAPDFERVMNELPPNQVSEPFETPFGWHILQVLDRREHDSTEAVKKAKAREAIMQRKLEEERQTWMRQLRDEAYVELRLDERTKPADPGDAQKPAEKTSP